MMPAIASSIGINSPEVIVVVYNKVVVEDIVPLVDVVYCVLIYSDVVRDSLNVSTSITDE